MSIEVPDLQTSSRFILGSVDHFSQCISSDLPVTATASAVTDKASKAFAGLSHAATSWAFHVQLFSAGLVVLGLALLFYGYKMVRPLNFLAGSYAGGTLSLLLLNIFAPALQACSAIIGVGIASGLVLGVLCALKRGSVLAVLGLVAGEIVGDIFYKNFLLPLHVPEFGAFFCIGFFAVLLCVIVGSVGDFAVRASSAFFGAYIALRSGLKLAASLAPPPYDTSLLAFGAFKPQLSLALTSATNAHSVDTLLASPYIYGPSIALALLTWLGIHVQGRLLRAAQAAHGDMEALIRK